MLDRKRDFVCNALDTQESQLLRCREPNRAETLRVWSEHVGGACQPGWVVRASLVRPISGEKKVPGLVHVFHSR